MKKKDNFTRFIKVNLPTKYGDFMLYAYVNGSPDHHHLALVKGSVKDKTLVPLRVHSSCVTGDILGSLKCDCGDQLQESFDYISKKNYGIIIYLFQEGRGIGLMNKLKAYKLQEEGLDTVEANIALGLPIDAREYYVTSDILNDLEVRSIELLTNNPQKIKKLQELGVKIDKVKGLKTFATEHNLNYLKTKKIKLGHSINL